MRIRHAEPADATAIAAIHAEGIEERGATFDLAPDPVDELAARIVARDKPFLVAERDGEVVAWAALSGVVGEPGGDAKKPGRYYVRLTTDGNGAAEYPVELDLSVTGAGPATTAAAEREGIYKLVGKLFPENAPSRRLFESAGFREVGLHLRHGTLDGEWRDVLLVERLVGPAGAG